MQRNSVSRRREMKIPMTKKKRFTKRYLRVFSRHPSHKVIRNKILTDKLTCIRLGSVSNSICEREINSIQSVINSSNKRLMKECFDRLGVKTARWWPNQDLLIESIRTEDESLFPILAKLKTGSRARGLIKINSQEELIEFIEAHNCTKYIFEKFHNYAREYRLHVSKDGCFYTCRKMLKRDSPDEVKFFRNDSNCVWFLESNDQFDKPCNWDEIVNQCILAIRSLGLDIGAIDLRIQSAIDSDGHIRNNPEFIIVEVNSAPSFGEETAKEYIKHLPRIIKSKYE